MRRWLLILLGGAVCMGCPHPGPAPVGPSPDADAGPAPVDSRRPAANCGAACMNERGLGCPGASACASLCPRLLRNHPEYVVCVTAATSCDAVSACDKAAVGHGATHGPGGGRTGP